MNKIAFLMRYDYQEKGGGDVVQVTSYIPYLESQGYQCELIKDLNLQNVNKFDIFILVNIDRPVETLHNYEMIKKNSSNKKIFLIPIHHPIDAINKFEKKERGAFFKLLCRFFPDFYSREKVKNFVRGIRYPKIMFLAIQHVFISYRLAIKNLLQSVDGVIYISNGERKFVEKDFDCAPKNYCIAFNAVEMDVSDETLPLKEIDVVVVGRIEPRKNQLNVVKVLSSMGVNAVFIGPENPNSKDYCEKFLNAVSSASNIQYLGAVEHSKVPSYLKKSRILLNASYFEVNPLVDLEAALVGCGVVTTKYSYSRESLPNVIEIDPWSNDSIREGVKNALDFPEKTIVDKNIYPSWDLPAKIILELISK